MNVELRPFVHDQIRYFTQKIGTTPANLMKQYASEVANASLSFLTLLVHSYSYRSITC